MTREEARKSPRKGRKGQVKRRAGHGGCRDRWRQGQQRDARERGMQSTADRWRRGHGSASRCDHPLPSQQQQQQRPLQSPITTSVQRPEAAPSTTPRRTHADPQQQNTRVAACEEQSGRGAYLVKNPGWKISEDCVCVRRCNVWSFSEGETSKGAGLLAGQGTGRGLGMREQTSVQRGDGLEQSGCWRWLLAVAG